MKKSLFQKFISILLSLTFLVSFSIPAYAATTPSQVPSGGFYQIEPTVANGVEPLSDGRVRFQIDSYDVVVVKQSTYLILWTLNALTSTEQTALENNIIGKKELGANNIADCFYFSGEGSYTGTLPQIGTYQVTQENGHYYIYISADNDGPQISHFIVHDKPVPVSFTIHATKAVSGASAPTRDFTFVLKDGQNNEVGLATRSGAGDVTFTMNEGYKLPAGGATLTMTEVAPNSAPAGWDYSKKIYTVSIDGVTGAVSYKDNSGTSVSTPIFTNTYTAPKPPSFTITANKVVSGDTPATMPYFSFILKDEKHQVVGSATHSGAGGVDFIMNASYVLPEGGATLTMTEDDANAPAGWDYSQASYTVKISAAGAVSYMDSSEKPVEAPTFTNTYTAPKPVSFTIKANKVVSGDTPAEMPDFSFALKDADNQTVGTATRNGAGAVTFTMNEGYKLPTGGATLTMTEVAPDPVPTGWTYSKASYTVSIDGVTGAILYQDSNGKSVGTATFTNTYTAPKPVSFTITANKVVSGDTPAEMPNFTFTLKDAENQTVGTATRNGAGAVTFTMNEGYKLPESGATLTMTEDSTAAPAGWTYSKASYTVNISAAGVVTYKDNATNEAVETPAFTNTYTAPKPVSFTITANKVVSGDTPANMPNFTFALKDADNQTVGTATRNGAGVVTFTMNEGYKLPTGGATLTMTEDDANAPAGWDYSQASYTVKISAAGAVSYMDSSEEPVEIPTFTNTYTAPKPPSFTITANKVVSGDTPAEMPNFSFILKDEKHQVVGSATRSGAGDVTFTMNEGYKLPEDGATLTMTEDDANAPAGWDYSQASYTVKISAAGVVTYKDNATNEAVTIPVFTNVYATEIIPEDPTPQTPPKTPQKPTDNLPEVIPDEPTPLASPQTGEPGHWSDYAGIALLASLAGGLVALAGIRKFRKARK